MDSVDMLHVSEGCCKVGMTVQLGNKFTQNWQKITILCD